MVVLACILTRHVSRLRRARGIVLLSDNLLFEIQMVLARFDC
jgi:hypothetical protein